jgi:ArsR family transcriptional regulator, arsenate/arsenite/antimonite-responsive transcriptional repressor
MSDSNSEAAKVGKKTDIQTKLNCIIFVFNSNIMTKEVFSENQKQLARFAKALGHPVRVYIMELLSKQSCCYSGDLSEDLPIAKSTLSQHLKELKEAGLIQGEIEAPKIKYCINRENWDLARNLFLPFLKKEDN